MELRLVDIKPTSDIEKKPETDARTWQVAPLALEPMTLTPTPTSAPAATPAPPAASRAAPSVARAPSESGREVSLQVVDMAPSVEAGSETDQQIELSAVSHRQAPGPTPSIPPPTDEFGAEALREYRDGNLDLPLWSRAISQHEGDQPAIIMAYLRARATALRIERRQRRARDPALPVPAAVPTRPLPFRQDEDDRAIEAPSRAAVVRRYAMFAAPGVAILTAAAWWMVSTSDRDSIQASGPASGSAAVPVVAASAPAAPAPVRVARAPKEEDSGTYFTGKILDLKSAGNWNVLVLFAAEWTRKQPENATAWRELSVGYTNMRQYADALEAATTAAKLAPADPLVWRNLAQVNSELREPDAALKAYEKAAALNELDVYSMLQVGLLNVELNRLPQAREAFDRVLAADPGNPEALCGTASIALRQGRGKDADATSKQLRGGDRKCREAPAPAAAAVASRK
ncbi:MAG: tetratricopeptide repeat protein [Casimicrobiaceae bacterium]